jgi:Flp pilus assembly protein TadD
MGGASGRSALVAAALGRAYLLLYDLSKERVWTDRAIAACEAARRLDPGLPEVHATLGALYNRTGKADDAAAEFERALELQPFNADALIGLADAHRAAGRFSEAVARYNEAISAQPGYWSGYSKLGAFYFSRAQYDKAAEQFREVIALTPDNSRAYLNLGSVYLFLEQLDDARAAFEKALALQPTSVGYSNLGTLEFYVGNYPAAARNFEKAVEKTPGNYLLWANLGDAYRWAPGMRSRAHEAYEKAVALAKESLAINPSDPAVHADVAAVYAKMGEPEEAARQIGRALQLDPRSTKAMYKAAVVAAVAGRRREAVDWIQQAVGGGYSRSQIDRDPEFATLRDDPAFREALKEVS